MGRPWVGRGSAVGRPWVDRGMTDFFQFRAFFLISRAEFAGGVNGCCKLFDRSNILKSRCKRNRSKLKQVKKTEKSSFLPFFTD